MTRHFKENAVNLSLERKNVSELTHELGISPTLFIACAKSTKSEGETVFPAMESVLVKERLEGLQFSWSISDNLTAAGLSSAIRMVHRNRPIKEDMILHSDRGIQYSCKQTVNLLQYYRVKQSMSGKGNCWVNAVAESFFKSFKTELIYGTKLKTREQMRLHVFEYIETQYNHKRRFSALGNLTIDEFRNQYNLKKE